MEGDTGTKAQLGAPDEFTSVFTMLLSRIKEAGLVCVGASTAYVLRMAIRKFCLLFLPSVDSCYNTGYSQRKDQNEYRLTQL
jgi:hypothetical protein